ncbi:MAG: hypothetical protein QG663_874 [Thermodesulfobacteriota bacterium]|nr:hypothetical protein [Thermodesulfobacteriota bacterium]
MKTIRVFLTVITAIIGVSLTSAMAQDSQWGQQATSPNFPGVPANHNLKRNNVSPAHRPAMPPPSVNLNPINYVCPPIPTMGCKTTSSEPSVYLGYLYKDHGGGIQMRFNDPANVGQLTFTRNDFDLQGIWLEFALPMTIQENMSALISGSHLFGLQSTAAQSYTLSNSPSAARNWNPDIQWWEVNAAGSYQFIPSVSGILGFRWSSFAVTFNNPSNQLGFPVPNTNQASLTTNAYIPYSGLMIETQPDCRSALKIGAYGCPFLPADFLYSENLTFSNQQSTSISAKANMGTGYFAEGVSEYSMRRDSLIMGAFARFSVLHVERSIGVALGGVNTPTDITFERKNWIFGGKIGCSF